MSTKVVVLGAGFGGLELSALLSETPGKEFEVTLIDRKEHFVFGFSKLDFMFGRKTPAEVQHPYADVKLPGVQVLHETITAIDPETRRVTTDAGIHDADALVIALGADFDYDATPGLAEFGDEFYSGGGAIKATPKIREFSQGKVVIGVCGAPFMCPPAPSECALLLHDELVNRGVRDQCEITFVIPFSTPVPPSPETSAALLAEFAERDINFIPGHRPAALDGERGIVTLDDGSELPYDLFLGVPKHRAASVVIDSGLTDDGYIPVDSANLKTKFPGVYAVGDVATAGVPKAGIFAEGAARVVAKELIAEATGGPPPEPHDGRGSCYIEFGEGRVARVDIDFLSGPTKTGTFNPPSARLVELKEEFATTRERRWFGA